MKLKKAQKVLKQKYGDAVHAEERDGCIYVTGKLNQWEDVVDACTICSTRYSKVHVVNDIEFTGAESPEIRKPVIENKELHGRKPDVLVIGGGISGATVTRELTKWKLDVMLVEKESDLAMQASGRNDGEVHPGVDLGKGNLKHDYVIPGNRMFDDICRDLNVPLIKDGQYGGTLERWGTPFVFLFVLYRKYFCGVSDTEFLTKKKLFRLGPNLNPSLTGGMNNPAAGSVCPYGLTIAYAENAAANGAQICLNTYVRNMEVEDGKIKSVETNKGVIYPKLVINAAGVFAEDIAKMAGDRFFSIHPRKGTNSITDKKTGKYVKGICSVKELVNKGPKNTKGGGILHTVHDNLLVGPDAIETYEKENFATSQSSIDNVFNKQKKAVAKLDQKDIITYFTGVRAPTFEEDFILERGRKTKNLIHLAGIQSPGLTAAPAFSVDMANLAVNMLKEFGSPVQVNENFCKTRKGIPDVKNLSDEERDALIKQNPDYGVIVCRCEEISKGEIIDALKAIPQVPTVDGIKKRIRPGMGRCQGGFCMPQVIKIISDFTGIPESEVKKNSEKSFISYGKTKEVK